jgi:ubiquitin
MQRCIARLCHLAAFESPLDRREEKHICTQCEDAVLIVGGGAVQAAMYRRLGPNCMAACVCCQHAGMRRPRRLTGGAVQAAMYRRLGPN